MGKAQVRDWMGVVGFLWESVGDGEDAVGGRFETDVKRFRPLMLLQRPEFKVLYMLLSYIKYVTLVELR